MSCRVTLPPAPGFRPVVKVANARTADHQGVHEIVREIVQANPPLCSLFALVTQPGAESVVCPRIRDSCEACSWTWRMLYRSNSAKLTSPHENPQRWRAFSSVRASIVARHFLRPCSRYALSSCFAYGRSGSSPAGSNSSSVKGAGGANPSTEPDR